MLTSFDLWTWIEGSIVSPNLKTKMSWLKNLFITVDIDLFAHLAEVLKQKVFLLIVFLEISFVMRHFFH